MDLSERWNIEALVTIDIEKAFDSVNHSLSVAVLKAFGLGKAFLHWIEILLTNQESCVLNSGATTKCETRQEKNETRRSYICVFS